MAYSKIILNGETLMDVTSDTVDADNLLSGETATKNNGTKVSGNLSLTETDPIFSASAAAEIESSDISNWNSKTSNTGTVTSVRVQATSPVQSSTSTAQAESLNTTISLASGYGDTKNPYASKTKNYVLAAPSNQNGTPSFRALVASDIPDLSSSYLPSSTSIPSKTSDLTNDSGYITGYTETDPTVPSWAKQSTKPSYTASEVGALPSSTVIPTITDTYSGTSSNGMSGKAVKSAIDALDGSVTGTAGSGKTLTALSQTDGKISATFGDISITKSQVSDFPTIPTVNNATLTIQKNGTTVKTFTANASSNVTANIIVPTDTDDLTNGAGYITGYTETDPTVPSWAKQSSKPSYTASEVGAASSSHTHGNITNAGDITAQAPTIASGDQIVINDNSASKITNGPTFDGATETTALTQKGTWASFSKCFVDLLWTNSSPLSVFSATQIGMDLSNYDMVEVHAYNSVQSGRQHLVSNTTEVGNSGIFIGIGPLTSASSSTIVIQRIYTVSTNNILFDAGYYRGVNEMALYVANDVYVPYKIYGIKLG